MQHQNELEVAKKTMAEIEAWETKITGKNIVIKAGDIIGKPVELAFKLMPENVEGGSYILEERGQYEFVLKCRMQENDAQAYKLGKIEILIIESLHHQISYKFEVK